MEDRELYSYSIVVTEKAVATTFENNNRSMTFLISKDKNETIDLINFVFKYVKGLIGFDSLDNEQYYLHRLLNTATANLKPNGIIYETKILKEKLVENNEFFKSTIAQLDLGRMLNKKGRGFSTICYANGLDLSEIDNFQNASVEEVILSSKSRAKAINILYNTNKDSIALRNDLLSKTGMDFFNVKEIDIVPKLIRKILKLPYRKVQLDNSSVPLGQIMFSDVKFKTKEFNSVQAYLSQQSVVKTTKELEYKVLYKGLTINYGTGGLHAYVEPGVFKGQIFYLDIKQFYPSLLRIYNVCPTGIGPMFNDALETAMKVIGKNHKLSLNGIIGKMNNPMNPLYDKKAWLTVTINAQLIFSSLVEQIAESCDEVELLTLKTDGMYFRIPERMEYDAMDIIADWMDRTKFDLHFATFDKIVIKDSNNVAAFKNDVIEQSSGLFKKFKVPIVGKAVIDYFSDGVPVDVTIQKENIPINDFALFHKAGKDSHIYVKTQSSESMIGRAIRYIVVKANGYGVYTKTLKAKKATMISNKPIIIINTLNGTETNSDYKLDYSYYISIAENIVKSIEVKQLKMF